MASLDFLTVTTATFRILYVFVVLKHDQREVVHFNVTQNQTAQWTAQQIVEAFPFDTAPRYLLRDRDSIHGEQFCRRVKSLGIEEEVTTAPNSPWQSPYVERLIDSIRRECLNHVIVLNERHLWRQLHSYFTDYHEARTHLSLAKQCPNSRTQLISPIKGVLSRFPMLADSITNTSALRDTGSQQQLAPCSSCTLGHPDRVFGRDRSD